MSRYLSQTSVPVSEQFSENIAQEKLSFDEQIMCKDKCLSIFHLSTKWRPLILPKNFATQAVLKSGECDWGIAQIIGNGEE